MPACLGGKMTKIMRLDIDRGFIFASKYFTKNYNQLHKQIGHSLRF